MAGLRHMSQRFSCSRSRFPCRLIPTSSFCMLWLADFSSEDGFCAGGSALLDEPCAPALVFC